MLVGQTPFKSQGKNTMLMNISKCKPKFPLSFPPQARDLISKILLKSTERETECEGDTGTPVGQNHAGMKETWGRRELLPIPLPQYHGNCK